MLLAELLFAKVDIIRKEGTSWCFLCMHNVEEEKTRTMV